MYIVVFLIVGLIAGWIASVLVEGRGLGFIGDIVIGIIGAFIGGYLSSSLGIVIVNNGFWDSVTISAFGAVILLFIVELIASGIKPHPPANRL